MNTKELPSAERLRELLAYNPETGVLTWEPRASNPQWTARYAGTVAGSVHTDKYGYRRIQVYVDGGNYWAHRLIWKLVTGKAPEGVVDHKSRDATDNRWMNLRDVSHEVNSSNRSLCKDNTSGVNGISWHKNYGKWQISKTHKKRRFVSFHETLEEAKELLDLLCEVLNCSGNYLMPRPEPSRV